MEVREAKAGGFSVKPSSSYRIDESLNLVMVATLWGNRDLISTIWQKVCDLARDKEFNVSDSPNILTDAQKEINRWLYNDVNSTEFNTIAEISLLHKKERLISFSHSGGHGSILQKANGEYLPYFSAIDLASVYGKTNLELPALPYRPLGLCVEPVITAGQCSTVGNQFYVATNFIQNEMMKATTYQIL